MVAIISSVTSDVSTGLLTGRLLLQDHSDHFHASYHLLCLAVFATEG
jgi:hypothetical protein